MVRLSLLLLLSLSLSLCLSNIWQERNNDLLGGGGGGGKYKGNAFVEEVPDDDECFDLGIPRPPPLRVPARRGCTPIPLLQCRSHASAAHCWGEGWGLDGDVLRA
jgi:hypothetical protein